MCTNMGCRDEAAATVPGYPKPLPKCFTHEREYVDRYGHEGVHPMKTIELDMAAEDGGTIEEAIAEMTDGTAIEGVIYQNPGPSGWPVARFTGNDDELVEMLDMFYGGVGEDIDIYTVG